MERKTVCFFLGGIFIAALCLGFIIYRNDTDRMLTRFNTQLKEEKFEEIYDESSASVHLNVTKEEFVRRMRIAAGKLKSIDRELAFQMEREIEKQYLGEIDNNGYGQFRRLQKLDKDGVSVVIGVFWDDKGIFPKFNDFFVVTGDRDARKYATPGVSYNKISNPENY